MRIEKLLVQTDLDDLSAKATDYAVMIATQMGVTDIVLLNIIVPAQPQTVSPSGDIFETDVNEINAFNAALMKKNKKLAEEEATKRSTEKVRIQPFVRFHQSKTDLNSYMEEFNAGLLVFGSHNEETFLDKFFDNEVEKVVRKVDYPIVIIRSNTQKTDVKNIIVAVDVEAKDQSGLQDVKRIADQLNARVHLLHVITNSNVSSDESITQLENLAAEYSFNDYDTNVVSNANLEAGLSSFISKSNADMIAVLAQGKGKIHKLLFGSTTEDIVQDVDKPVLVSRIN